MRKLKLFTHCAILATTPTLLAYPQHNPPQASFQVVNYGYGQETEEWVRPTTYDEIMLMLEDLESGELERRYPPEQLVRVNEYLATLAKEGILPNEFEEEEALEEDTYDLMYGEDSAFQLTRYLESSSQYMIIPAVLNGYSGYNIVQCGGIGHAWKKTKKFAKKHKKKIIIGAAVVVAVTVVVVAVVATSAAAAATAAAGAAGAASSSNNKSDKKGHKEESSSPAVPTDVPPGMAATHEAPTLKSAIDNQISSFKENIVQNQFFQPTDPAIGHQGLSWEENGRALGSIFAHDSYNNIQNQIPYHPRLAQEVEDINSKYTFPIPGGYQGASIAHPEIDRKFSTDYTSLYSNPSQEADFNTLSHQVRGERALAFGYYNQAVQDLGKAIETNPTNPVPYLERGIAHFGLGQYDRSLEDYKQFTVQSQAQKPDPLSVSEFSLGVSKGLPKGVYESGKGFFLFMADFVKHPIQTSGQIVDSVTTLAHLVRNDEWGVIAEVLSPEMHQLVTQWDTLSSEKKGELAGYAVGKHGADILAPGALAKVASKSIKSAQELAAVCKNLQIAQETLVLETAAEIGNGAKIAEVLEAGRKTAFLAEELGFTAREAGQLKQAGILETTVSKRYDHLSLSMQESIALHKKAQDVLKPYAKKPMPEFKVRELIHETGFPTFAKPKGIPEDFLVMVADRGAGMEYVHPTNTHIRVRVMPGKPHSPNPSQQKPYVVQQKSGQAFDKHGNLIQPEKTGAHIPLEEFIYRE